MDESRGTMAGKDSCDFFLGVIWAHRTVKADG